MKYKLNGMKSPKIRGLVFGGWRRMPIFIDLNRKLFRFEVFLLSSVPRKSKNRILIYSSYAVHMQVMEIITNDNRYAMLCITKNINDMLKF